MAASMKKEYENLDKSMATTFAAKSVAVSATSKAQMPSASISVTPRAIASPNGAFTRVALSLS